MAELGATRKTLALNKYGLVPSRFMALASSSCAGAGCGRHCSHHQGLLLTVAVVTAIADTKGQEARNLAVRTLGAAARHEDVGAVQAANLLASAVFEAAAGLGTRSVWRHVRGAVAVGLARRRACTDSRIILEMHLDLVSPAWRVAVVPRSWGICDRRGGCCGGRSSRAR